jgi:hypothetical protein
VTARQAEAVRVAVTRTTGDPRVMLCGTGMAAPVLLTVDHARQAVDALATAVATTTVTWVAVGPVAMLTPTTDPPVLSVWSVGTGAVRLVVDDWQHPTGWTLPRESADALAVDLDAAATHCERAQ